MRGHGLGVSFCSILRVAIGFWDKKAMNRCRSWPITQMFATSESTCNTFGRHEKRGKSCGWQKL
ncbi:MAG: hypothetical protein A2092_01070 [Rhodobacteraceae bacterium GWE1_64_9]|nr:MAG: hypothetical protein A2092_01070 [Rhodobacteraceae bacterium GWE1_64_9]